MGKKKVDKSRIEKGIEKEEKTFALMAEKIVNALEQASEFIMEHKNAK